MTRAKIAIGLVGGLVGGALLAGCLPAPQAAPGVQQCYETSDCDTSVGEVCGEGMCWGGPPAAMFAAVLGPPTGRDDLEVTELASLDLPADGWVGDLSFAPPVTISGRVVLDCGDPPLDGCVAGQAIAAQILVTRPSRISGGPVFYRTATADPAATGDTFSIRLPRLQPGDEPYSVVVVPDDGRSGIAYEGPTPAALAAPLRLALDATADVDQLVWEVGDPDVVKLVTGRVVNGVGVGLESFEVVALAKWTALGELERGSTLAVTDAEGRYVLRLAVGMTDVFDIVATPRGGATAPVLRARDLYAADPPCTRRGADCEPTPIALDDLRMPSYPTPVTFRIPVEGVDSNGVAAKVVAAELTLTTLVTDPLMPLTQDAVFSQTVFTGADGEAEVTLIPGAPTGLRRYTARIRPAAGTQQASVYDHTIEVGVPSPAGGGGSLATIALPRRLAISGTVVDADGVVVAGATVSAQPSLAFSWSIDEVTERLARSLVEPSAITDDAGGFLLWVDPVIGLAPAEYDLAIEPPNGALVPRWSILADSGDGDDKPDTPALELGDIWLPPAAFIHGRVVDLAGDPVSDAEVRVLEVATDDSICDLVNAPREGVCAPPAALRGAWRSDQDGVVWMVLPNPPRE